jgi:hypothetical protein
MRAAWFWASVVMMAGLIAYYVIVELVASPLVVHVGWAIPASGAAVAAFVAPRQKFNVGAATVVVAVLLVGVGSYVAGKLGVGDFIGAQGTAIAMVLALPLIALSSACGALLGELASKVRSNA